MGFIDAHNNEHKNYHKNYITQEYEEINEDRNIAEDNIEGDMAPTMPMEISPICNDVMRDAAISGIVTATNKKYGTRSRENMHEQK